MIDDDDVLWVLCPLSGTAPLSLSLSVSFSREKRERGRCDELGRDHVVGSEIDGGGLSLSSVITSASVDGTSHIIVPGFLAMTNARGKQVGGSDHGGTRRRAHRSCTIVGCLKQVQQGGVCCEHGAKTRRSPCSTKGCVNFSQRGGLCRRHGAFLLETCHVEGCKRIAKNGRLCDSHHASSDADAKASIEEMIGGISLTESWVHERCTDEAKGYASGMHDMATTVHTPSAVDDKAISEVDVDDLEIISMYLVESGELYCGMLGGP